MLRSNFWKRSSALMLTVFTLSFSALVIADARPGGSRSSSGSRGSHTQKNVPATPTAPNSLNRTQTPAAPAAGAAARAPQQGSFMSRFGTGMMAGLLGAGLFGLLTGSGLMGGLGGIMSFLGLILQMALLGFLGFMIYRFFKRRQQPAMAGMPQADYQQGFQRQAEQPISGGYAPMPQSAPQAQAVPERVDHVGITGEDYNAFENTLIKVQDHYGREDLAGLEGLVDHSLLREFAQDLEENKRQGVHNQTGGAKLLQGDLAESWREQDGEYASVALRYSLFDVVRQRTSGQVIEGSMATPLEVTEVWTFKRPAQGAWKLIGIDQA